MVSGVLAIAEVCGGARVPAVVGLHAVASFPTSQTSLLLLASLLLLDSLLLWVKMMIHDVFTVASNLFRTPCCS